MSKKLSRKKINKIKSDQNKKYLKKRKKTKLLPFSGYFLVFSRKLISRQLRRIVSKRKTKGLNNTIAYRTQIFPFKNIVPVTFFSILLTAFCRTSTSLKFLLCDFSFSFIDLSSFQQLHSDRELIQATFISLYKPFPYHREEEMDISVR